MAAYAADAARQDERLLLLNRFVPVLPAAGAFIFAAGWRPWRALGFVALGSVLKYGILLAASALAFHCSPPRRRRGSASARRCPSSPPPPCWACARRRAQRAPAAAASA